MVLCGAEVVKMILVSPHYFQTEEHLTCARLSWFCNQ